jgi:ribosome biogenesis protein MAK21
MAARCTQALHGRRGAAARVTRRRARPRRALYATLLAPELPGSTKAAMFLSLLFRALKADVSGRRVAAFLKRLLQVALAAPPNLACGCLLLTSEVLKARARAAPAAGRAAEGRCASDAAGWHSAV